MDCEMPVLDGYETTRRIRAAKGGRNAGVPIVALTADAMPEVRSEYLAAGMNDYMAKPVWPAELAAVLTRWLCVQSPSPGSRRYLGGPPPAGVTCSLSSVPQSGHTPAAATGANEP